MSVVRVVVVKIRRSVLGSLVFCELYKYYRIFEFVLIFIVKVLDPHFAEVLTGFRKPTLIL